VVAERLLDDQQLLPRAGIGHVRILTHLVTGDHRVPSQVRVVDIEDAAGGVVGGELQAQKTALAAGADPIPEVQERFGQHPVAVEEQDLAALLDDEQPWIARWRRQVDGALQSVDHAHGPDPDGRLLPAAGELAGRVSGLRHARQQREHGPAPEPVARRGVRHAA